MKNNNSRRYKTERFSGIFAPKIQPSVDPEFFGMQIDEEVMIEKYGVHWSEDGVNTIEYILVLDDNSIGKISEKLDECYESLGFPHEKRIYLVDSQNELDSFMEDDNFHLNDKNELSWHRLKLGLIITSELKKTAICELSAEI